MDRKTNRRGKPTRLNSLTEKLIGPAMMARGFSHSRIVTEWPQAASTAADWSEPASITFPRGQSRDGTLQVNIRSGRGPEMQMMIPAIIENCNAVFGYAAVARITITQVAMDATMKGAPPEPAAPKADHGDKGESYPLPDSLPVSEDLRKTLDNLGKSLSRRNRG